MKILILGGTRFVGRHLTQAALDAGHDVTLFNRGQSNSGLFPQAEQLTGDRDGGLAALENGRWDAVLDVNGYMPRIVQDSVEMLKERAGYYLFVSTMSVYADWSQPLDEDSPLIELADPNVAEFSMENYGGLKVLCERVVQDAFGERACVVRPTFVVGPYDHSDRFPYWLWRAARGGKMIAPGGPEEPVPYIDGRDMGAWMVRLAEALTPGVYNALAPRPFTFGELFAEVARQTGSDPQPVWIAAEFAEAQGLTGANLPLWAPGEEYAGHGRSTNQRAAAAGLQVRPFADTVADTLAWINEREAAGHEWKTGIPAEQEQQLLAKQSEQ